MPDTKIGDLDEAGAGSLDDADQVVVVDVSDTTMHASGTTKRSLWSSVRAQLKTYFDTLYSASGHTHAASDVTSGTMATARLGSGTANSTTYLRGDQTWATVSASPAGSSTELQYRNSGAFGAATAYWNSGAGVLSIGGTSSTSPGLRTSGSLSNTLEIVSATGSAWGNLRTSGYVQADGFKTSDGTGASLKSDNTSTHLAAFNSGMTTITGFAGTQFRVTAGTGDWTIRGKFIGGATAGVVEYCDGSGGFTGTALRIGGGTVAQLPSASGAGAGARAFVTDATASTFASTVSGGGSTKVPVYSDGTNWLIG